MEVEVAKTISICAMPECINPMHSHKLCRAHVRRLKKYGSPYLGRELNGFRQRFVAQALSQKTDECILWPYSSAGPMGYGVFDVNGVHSYVHRYVCEAIYGKPRRGDQAAHSCGVAKCINWQHLRWASPVENARDKIAHGTANKGSKHGMTKLTENDVLAIRGRLQSGTKQVVIHREYGISRMTVSRIANRLSWTHI